MRQVCDTCRKRRMRRKASAQRISLLRASRRPAFRTAVRRGAQIIAASRTSACGEPKLRPEQSPPADEKRQRKNCRHYRQSGVRHSDPPQRRGRKQQVMAHRPAVNPEPGQAARAVPSPRERAVEVDPIAVYRRPLRSFHLNDQQAKFGSDQHPIRHAPRMHQQIDVPIAAHPEDACPKEQQEGKKGQRSQGAAHQER